MAKNDKFRQLPPPPPCPGWRTDRQGFVTPCGRYLKTTASREEGLCGTCTRERRESMQVRIEAARAVLRGVSQ